jgi:heme/copper-type cytochrome/quinol oxidase subunit 2
LDGTFERVDHVLNNVVLIVMSEFSEFPTLSISGPVPEEPTKGPWLSQSATISLIAIFAVVAIVIIGFVVVSARTRINRRKNPETEDMEHSLRTDANEL